MKKLQKVILDIMSKIDDDIIDRNTITRIELLKRVKKKSSKKIIAWVSVAASFALIFGVLLAVFIPILTKQVPVYQGMTVSREYTAPQTAQGDLMSEIVPINLLYSGYSLNNNGVYIANKDAKDKFDKRDHEIVKDVEDKLNITGSEKKVYYAEKKQDIYITVHIDNPDAFEILSFTLNGEKYSSYMFEYGSDLENLILKVNVGDNEGVVEYTIDAIKYVDGDVIKDVRMEGDKTVKVGVRTDKLPEATITEETVTYKDISFNVEISDIMKLIDFSQGRVDVVLYEGENIVASQNVSLDGETKIEFLDLNPGREYTYVVTVSYDALDGKGYDTYILAKKSIKTLDILSFEEVNITQIGVGYKLVLNESYISSEIKSVALYQGDTKIRDLSKNDNSIDGLLSNTKYKIVAEYRYGDKDATVVLDFTTVAKATPKIELSELKTGLNSISFKIDESDADNIGEITKVELLSGTTVVKTSTSRQEVSFTELDSNTQYTIALTYEYDLNDGNGKKVKEVKNSIKTKFDFGIGEWEFSTGIDVNERGEIVGIGTCKDKILFLDKTIADDCNAFASSNIREVYIDGAERIGSYAFYGCQYLTTVKMSDTVNQIRNEAFAECPSLTDVRLSNNLTHLLNRAFAGCYNLTNIDIPDSVTRLGGEVFSRTAITSIKLPKGVTSISSAFAGTGIETIELHEGITYISANAFNGCHNLKTIVIPSSVVEIRDFAFSECFSLTEIIIPKSVEKIAYDAFTECGATIYCEAESKPEGWEGEIWNDTTRVHWGYVASN